MERETFYAMAAQVIPTLFLVLVLEARLRPRLYAGAGARTYNLTVVVSFGGIMLFIILGEIIALTNLWRGKELDGGGLADFFVLFAIVMELVLIFLFALLALLVTAFPALDEPKKKAPRPPSWQESP